MTVESRCDVLVCSLGHKTMIKEKLHVLRDLWAAGIKADLIHDATKVSGALNNGVMVNCYVFDSCEVVQFSNEETHRFFVARFRSTFARVTPHFKWEGTAPFVPVEKVRGRHLCLSDFCRFVVCCSEH